MAGKPTVAARAAEKVRPAVRERIADQVDAEFQPLLQTLREASTAKKKIRVFNDCVKCGCKHAVYVEVPDTAMQLKVAEFLMNQGFGRPGEDDSGKGSGDFVVQRFVVEPSEDLDPPELD